MSGKINHITNYQNCKYLYINIDDTYLHTIQSKKLNKNCFRVLCVHQGKNKQNELINKSLIAINIQIKTKYRTNLSLINQYCIYSVANI